MKTKGKPCRVPIHALNKRPRRNGRNAKANLRASALSWLETPSNDTVDVTVIDGHRRLAALKLLGLECLDVTVVESTGK